MFCIVDMQNREGNGGDKMPGQQKHENVFGAMPEGGSGIAPNTFLCFFLRYEGYGSEMKPYSFSTKYCIET